MVLPLATALTFLVNNLQKTPDGRYILYVGVDNNHSVLEGDEYSEACSVFAQIIGFRPLLSKGTTLCESEGSRQMKPAYPVESSWFSEETIPFGMVHVFYASKSLTHLPGTIDVDVTKLVAAADRVGIDFRRPRSWSKPLFLRDKPHLNRMLFHTFFGKRIAEFDEIRVNLPVIIANNGKPVLSAMVFERVLEKRVPELHQEIRDFTKSDLSKLPITRFATTRGNYFWNRLVLRTIHMMVNRFPRLYATKGGGFQ